jgi:hypothetical protein
VLGRLSYRSDSATSLFVNIDSHPQKRPEELGRFWTRIVSSCGIGKDAGKAKMNVTFTLEEYMIIAALFSLRVRES